MKGVVLLKSRLNSKGGAEKYALRLAQAFLEEKCAVTLLTSGSLDSPAPTQYLTVESLSSQPWLSVQKVKAFDRFCMSRCKGKEIVLGLDRNSFQTHLRASNGVHAAFLRAAL